MAHTHTHLHIALNTMGPGIQKKVVKECKMQNIKSQAEINSEFISRQAKLALYEKIHFFEC